MFFQLYSVYPCYIMNEFRSLPRCKVCGRDFEIPNYTGVRLRADKIIHQLKKPSSKGLNRWPMSLGSFQSILLHEDVVNEFEANKIQGVKYHPIAGIEGKVLYDLPPPPIYYKVEPLKNTNFFPSLEEFDLIDCTCGVVPQQKVFGDYKSPFQIDENLIRGQDFFSVLPGGFWTCVNRKIINLLIQNQWTDEFEIGSRALPGTRIREFGARWYEDTLLKLKTCFPSTIIPD